MDEVFFNDIIDKFPNEKLLINKIDYDKSLKSHSSILNDNSKIIYFYVRGINLELKLR